MIPERWQRLEDLFHAMLELPADSRAAALAAACGDDSELRVELERLLQSHAGMMPKSTAVTIARPTAAITSVASTSSIEAPTRMPG